MVYKKQRKYKPDDFDEAELQHFFDYEYQDRGILKWQGFFLSDHTSALKKVQQELTPERQPRQSEEEIARQLMQAWENHHPVTLQLEEVDDNLVPQEVSGVIAGYYENEVVVQHVVDEKTSLVLLESLRNIRPANPEIQTVDRKEWY